MFCLAAHFFIRAYKNSPRCYCIFVHIFLYSFREETGDNADIIRLTRHLLNRAIANRVISKQECMVHLAGLDLVLCSEIIEIVSISGSYKVMTSAANDMLAQYRKRQLFKSMSLHKFFHKIKNKDGPVKYIPHYVGGNGQPKYPVTVGYARATLIIHEPWSDKQRPSYEGDWIRKFEDFLNAPHCPSSVKVAYERVRYRYNRNLTHAEPTAGEECYDMEIDTSPDQETEDLLSLVSTMKATLNPEIIMNQNRFDRGINYDWGKRIYPVSFLF